MWNKVVNLNSTSEYIQLYKDVFGEYADLNKMLKYDFESCITTTKEWELANSTYAGNSIQTGSALYNTYQKKNNTKKLVEKTIGLTTAQKMAKAAVAPKYKITWDELTNQNTVVGLEQVIYDPVINKLHKLTGNLADIQKVEF